MKTFDPYLRYSGCDSLCSRLAVVKKGILLTDLASYAASATGIPVDGTATADAWAMDPRPHHRRPGQPLLLSLLRHVRVVPRRPPGGR